MRAVRRMMDRKGEDVTIRNYTQTGTDEYGDPEFDETSETVKAIVSTPTQPQTGKTAGGEVIDVDIVLHFHTDADIVEPRDETPRGTRIERGDDTYRPLIVFEDDNELIRVEAVRHDK